MKPTAILALALLAASAVADDSLRVHFIDVGHGDCIFIQTPDDGIPINGRAEGYRVLIDAGEVAYSDSWPFTYLRQLGLQSGDTIDFVIASHLHKDHIDGLPMIYDSFHVLNTVEPGYPRTGVPDAFYAHARRESAQGSTYWCDPIQSGLIDSLGDTLDLGDELDVRLLFYDATTGAGDRSNPSSLVLHVRYDSVSFLFMGDAPKAVERRLVARYGGDLKSTVLKVSHHGSKTACDTVFLDSVSPRFAVVSAGLRHTLPKDDVLARLEQRGAEVWRTDYNDADTYKDSTSAYGDDNILVVTDGKNPRPDVRWNR